MLCNVFLHYVLDIWFRFLKESGCEFAQGYYFGKPLPMAESRVFTRAKGLKWEEIEQPV